MAENSLVFNEHEIRLIAGEIQGGSAANSPIKNNYLERRDIQKELLEFESPFSGLSISDILVSSSNSTLRKSDILHILLILGSFKSSNNDLKIKTTSKYFWLLVLKCKIFRINIFQNKYNSMTLCKLWRSFQKLKDINGVFQLIQETKEVINKNKNLK